MEKVLITGGNGFLGANLVRMLSKNFEVRIFVRSHADMRALEGLSPEIVYGNIDDEQDVYRAVEGVGSVIHTAGITDQTGIGFEEYERINVTATKYVAQACLMHKIRKLIYVSSANTIAPGNMNDPGTELNGFYYFKANSGYINSKYLGQQFILEQVVQNKLPAVVVNPTFMIGAHDIKPSSGRLVLYGMNKRILFYPPGGKNFVHIDDVCQGIVRALDRGKIGDCYLLAGENLSYKSFFKILNEVSGGHPLMIKIPGGLLKLAASLNYLMKWVTKEPVRLTKTTAYLLCKENYYSGNKSERELGLRYHSAKEAIADAYHWFAGN